ncbi:protein of unknown function DUF4114 [Yasminevirus sp. GU-2018]|uniref:DUF4114 domain-containing protein n=1 Tax=Yasminevirus sp. GU-2018 TaxID=2420051 RepID=A0A5K0U8W7_9VIRU|nr:protein of unknown function DUF4114 [Yasminevirus sp. GU-2018]
MSLPSGSKELSGSIGPTNVYYLTNEYTVSSSFSTSYYTSQLAKPKVNLTQTVVDPNIIRTVEEALPETSNNVASLFTKFPNIINNDPDITVGSTETDIEVTFVSEGAGYLNAFGYYFYYINGSGAPKILTNSDSNTNSNQSDPYYRPTIVFPNASYSRSGGDLQAGMTRKLKGNLPNGKFKNVKVGFFVIPNGWKTSGNGYLSKGTGYVMHTTNVFNANYNPAYLNESNVALSDVRRGIQSALLFYMNELSWILSFEDILRPSGDSDYNDLVLLVKKTPSPDSTEIARYTSVVPSADADTVGQADSDGLFLWLDASKVCTDGSNLVYDRKTYFRSTNIRFMKDEEEVSISPKEYVKSIMTRLNWNYTSSGAGIVDETATTITQRFTFRPSDITTNTKNGKVKLYLLSRNYNVENTTPVNDVGQTNYDMLLDYQSVFVDLWYKAPGTSTYIINEDFTFKCGSTQNTDLETLGTNFEKTTLVLLAWGDPYIQKLDGTAYKVPDTEGIYTLLQNSKIVVEAETSKSPHTEQLPEFQGTTFFKRFVIDIKNKSRFEIDLNTFTFSAQGAPIRFSMGYDKDSLRNLNDECLKSAIESETNFSCLSVYIEGVKVTFVKLPSRIDIQNVVLFDMGSIKYYAMPESQGGMIHQDQLNLRSVNVQESQ